MQKSTRKSKGWPLGPQPEHKKVKGKSPGIICPKCHAVFFDKHWHGSDALYQAYKTASEIVYEMCPEDKMIEEGHGETNYEGEAVFLNVPPGEVLEIVQQIRNIGKRAERRDPEDKIIKIDIKGRLIRVLTTENQLAVSIAKQVDKSHKGGKLEIKWSDGDQTARAVWEFKK